ncbi:MAG: PAS domain S-box protein [Desulfobacteraceae bacterium]|nr:MAG: PAS domain S-box protein [Desulfobacteraceae bacterium]
MNYGSTAHRQTPIRRVPFEARLQSLKRFSLLPLAILAILTTVVAVLDIRVSLLPPFLFPLLQTVLVFVVYASISYLAGVGFQRTGSWEILLFGTTLLLFGTALMLAAYLSRFGGLNTNTTIHNTSALLGTIVLLVSMFFATGSAPPAAKTSRMLLTVVFYGAAIAFMATVAILTLLGLTPSFFTASGPTALRQVLYGTATILLAISTTWMSILYYRYRADFLYWSFLGFGLIVLGFAGGLFVHVLSDAVSWLCRLSWYFSSFYFWIAGLAMHAEARKKSMGIPELLDRFIRHGKRNYEFFLETASDAIISMDRRHRILLWNAAAERLFGYSSDEALGQNLFDLIVPPQGTVPFEKTVENLPLLEDGRSPIVLELTVRKRSGETFPTEISLSVRRLSVGHFARTAEIITTMSIRDITERKRAEAAVIRSRMTFAELVERAPFGIYVVDSEFRVAHMNAGSQTGAFRNVQPVIGRDFDEVMHILWPEPVAEEIIAHFRHTLDTGEPYYSPRFINPRHDIAVVESYEWELHRMALPDGRYGVICYYFDSTKLREAEAALRESEERFRLAAKAAKIGAYSRDFKTGQDYWSPEFLAIYGLGPGEPLPMKEGVPAAVHPEDRQIVLNAARSRIECPPENEFSSEHRIILPDGEIRWVMIRGRMEFDAQKQPLRSHGFAMEITERKRAEEELRKLNETLEQRVAERTELAESRARQLARLTSELALTEERERRRLAEVLHDHLQQLLVGARLNLDILHHQAEDGQKQALEAARSLLAESIQTSRSITAELSPPILYQNGLIAGLEWLSRWMREKHGFSVEMQIEPDVVIEREAMLVVLFKTVRELLFNAVKHSGVNTAKASLFRDGPDRLKIVVSDTGKGFDPDRKLEHGEEKGGYGLFAIRERLEFLGGRFEAESAPGKGASFTITVPVKKAVPAQKSIVFPNAPPMKSSEKKSPTLRVLLVDDHAVVRQGLSMILSTQEDIEVVGQAADGEEAVALAREVQPDVILMDISLPGINGIEAARRIHAEQPGIRILCLSMFEDHDMAASALQSGAAEYLTKSGDTEVLLSAIRGQGKGASLGGGQFVNGDS